MAIQTEKNVTITKKFKMYPTNEYESIMFMINIKYLPKTGFTITEYCYVFVAFLIEY